jgi:hypothetical protein
MLFLESLCFSFSLSMPLMFAALKDQASSQKTSGEKTSGEKTSSEKPTELPKARITQPRPEMTACLWEERRAFPVVSRNEQVYERTAVPISRQKSVEIK